MEKYKIQKEEFEDETEEFLSVFYHSEGNITEIEVPPKAEVSPLEKSVIKL